MPTPALPGILFNICTCQSGPCRIQVLQKRLIGLLIISHPTCQRMLGMPTIQTKSHVMGGWSPCPRRLSVSQLFLAFWSQLKGYNLQHAESVGQQILFVLKIKTADYLTSISIDTH